ncbi:flagellar biosynthetic protein FliO [Cupriavidus sp. 8B]
MLAVLIWAGVRRWRQNRAGPPRIASGWTAWLAQRAGHGSVRVQSSTRLSGRASLHVIQWDGQEWLLGCTEQNISLLGQRPARGRDVSTGDGAAAAGGES